MTEYAHYAVLFDGLTRVTQVIVIDVPVGLDPESAEFERLARTKLDPKGWTVDAVDDVGDTELQEHQQVFVDANAA